jgi:hypothetical protein
LPQDSARSLFHGRPHGMLFIFCRSEHLLLMLFCRPT